MLCKVCLGQRDLAAFARNRTREQRKAPGISARLEPSPSPLPAVQAVLRKVPLDGPLVTADALPPQSPTARIVVPEKGGDYLFTVKGNQPGVAANVKKFYRSLARALSPSGQNIHRPEL